MDLQPWEATIQQIVDESNHYTKQSGRHGILTAWRAKLEKEPTSLRPYQIDQIMREVWTRMASNGRSARILNAPTRPQSPEPAHPPATHEQVDDPPATQVRPTDRHP